MYEEATLVLMVDGQRGGLSLELGDEPLDAELGLTRAELIGHVTMDLYPDLVRSIRRQGDSRALHKELLHGLLRFPESVVGDAHVGVAGNLLKRSFSRFRGERAGGLGRVRA